MATLALPMDRPAISVGSVLQRAMDTVRHNPVVSDIGTPQFTVGYVVGGELLTLISHLLWGSVHASLYVELVELKEGGSVENLADVFA